MSVTAAQQQTIDLAIASFLRTNDNTARQYLKLRQDVLETTEKITQSEGPVDPELVSRLQTLKFEYAKMKELYSAYVKRIILRMESPIPEFSYPSELDPQIAELEEKKERIEREMESLKTAKKPVVEKIKQLGARYESGATVKSSRPLGATKYMSHDAKANENSTFLDQESAVFARSEIEGLFADVKSKLASLKTVDEISEQNDEPEKPDAAHSININKYLDEVLQGNRAYTRLDGERYRYDISKSTALDVGNSKMSIDEYQQALETTIREIQGLVVRGTAAKERWLSNARKMEMIHALLSEDMELD